MPELRGEVEFDHVSFAYEPGVPVLREVSFRAPAGTTTALVGSSGSGKSTLISLVMAFNRPTGGRVLVDGIDLSSLRLRDYRSNLGVVLQDNFLFDGTIAENIAFSKPGATRREIEAAATVAHCDEFVSRMADAYDTIVGERGVKLSGGQRQRVAIARAILADPKILILDEATSSLDSESEAMIRDGLRRLREGRTTFVIAHRLSTIASADQILVLEEGPHRRARAPSRSSWPSAGATGSSTRSSTGRSSTSSSTRGRRFRRSSDRISLVGRPSGLGGLNCGTRKHERTKGGGGGLASGVQRGGTRVRVGDGIMAKTRKREKTAEDSIRGHAPNPW